MCSSISFIHTSVAKRSGFLIVNISPSSVQLAMLGSQVSIILYVSACVVEGGVRQCRHMGKRMKEHGWIRHGIRVKKRCFVKHMLVRFRSKQTTINGGIVSVVD